METINTILSGLRAVAHGLSFLFLTPWGWIILGTLLLLILLKQGINGNGQWQWYVFLLNLSEKAGSLLIWLPQIITSLLLLFAVALFEKDIRLLYENLHLARENALLAQTLKNLQFEGKLLEIRVSQTNNAYLLTLSHFTHSPWQNRPIHRHTETLVVHDDKAYVDFGVCNFEYSLIAEGKAYNLAFPYRIYTETQAPERGYSLFSGSQGLLWVFDIPSDDLIGIEKDDFQRMGARIVAAVTNASLARQLGIRTFYGQAIGFDVVPGARYRFVTTGTGGVRLQP